MPQNQIELETKIAFLEQHIGELSDVLYAQQKTIDQMQAEHKRLQEQVTVLLHGGDPAQADEKPPHY
ncbi:MAG: SlyX family protein [Pseudomonadales bacterium]|nr:SlyX family protein [Pseudomonadales bacterium]